MLQWFLEFDVTERILYGAAIFCTFSYLISLIMKMDKKSVFREYATAGFVAVWLALGIRSTIIENYEIPSESMVPTFLVGDRLFVSKFVFGWHIPGVEGRVFDFNKPERGDIVIFVPPHKPKQAYVKRCVAVPGDTIEVKDKMIFINGKPADHPQAQRMGITLQAEQRQMGMWAEGMRDGWLYNKDWMGPYTLPENMYWMMGDNRDNSFDSRYFGPVPYENVRGKPLLRYWPLGRFGVPK